MATTLWACSDPSAAPPTSGDGGPLDAALDAGVPDDAARDAGSPDPGDRWAHCPQARNFVGDTAWPVTLEATGAATYCTRFDESRTLVEELAAKAMFRIVPGTYRLPASDGAYPFLLPSCIALSAGPGRLQTGTGTLTHTATVYEGDTYHHTSFVLPLTAGAIEGAITFVQRGAALSPVVLDGRPEDPFEVAGSSSLSICPSGDCTSGGAVYFDSCTHQSSAPQLHHVTLAEGAEVHFEIRIGTSGAGTEPAAFVRAQGRFGGVDFDQRDYWKLVYNPSHHHFERHFAVFFDAPIAGVCGLEVEGLEPYDSYQPDRAYAVDCALGRLREIGVIAHSWER